MFVVFISIIDLFSIFVYIGGVFVIEYFILFFWNVCKIGGIDMLGGFRKDVWFNNIISFN